MDALHKRSLGEAAIGAGHDIVAADKFCQPHQPLGHQTRMFDDIGRMRNDAGNEFSTFR